MKGGPQHLLKLPRQAPLYTAPVIKGWGLIKRGGDLIKGGHQHLRSSSFATPRNTPHLKQRAGALLLIVLLWNSLRMRSTYLPAVPSCRSVEMGALLLIVFLLNSLRMRTLRSTHLPAVPSSRSVETGALLLIVFL